MFLKDFIKSFIQYDNILQFINKSTTDSPGTVFEKLWDLFIKFGVCSSFPNSEYTHKEGNMNMCQLTDITDLDHYIQTQKINTSKSRGVSDITLQHNSGEYIFISSKYFLTEKTISEYDIQNILSVIQEHSHVYVKYKIYLLVANKESLLKKIKLSNKSSLYLKKQVSKDTIFDLTDLEICFQEFKRQYAMVSPGTQLTEWFMNPKPVLKLRYHQDMISQKTHDLMKKGQKEFLWGCKCRSGKTYIVGGLVQKMHSKAQKVNILIVTPAPTETISAFAEGMFLKYRDFSGFKIHNIKSSKNLECFTVKNSNIFIISKQLIQRYIENPVSNIKYSNLDLIVFDETHFSGTTDLSKKILNTYSSKNTTKVYLSGTYAKPLKEYCIPKESQFYWDIEDEQLCANLKTEELIKKHGTCADLAQLEEYKIMPQMYILSTLFDQERYQSILAKQDTVYGFSFETLFSGTDSGGFNYVQEIKLLLRYISGSNKEQDFPKGDNSMFGRINRESSRKCFTQIWFLPPNGIQRVSDGLRELMQEDFILKQYDIMCINRKNTELAKNIKLQIENQEIKTRAQGKRGLIILAGNMLNLGITIESCDAVFLMNDSISSDKVIQQMYRSMTEANNKKYGFIIDLNISRVLSVCSEYVHLDQTIESRLKYITEHNLINIDLDMIKSHKITTETFVNKLMQIWSNDPINKIKTILKKLHEDYRVFDNETQGLINTYFISRRDPKITISMSEQQLQTGVSRTPTEPANPVKKELAVNFTKDVLPYVIPLVCLLTIKDKNNDFIEMLNYIKSNEYLLRIFDEQCGIWWKTRGLVDFIKDTIEKYFNRDSYVYLTSLQIKMCMESLIDNPNMLLELISDCLKPRIIEKRDFGEVFTPMEFVNKMLDSIGEYYQKRYSKNLWETKDLKILDPAVGMGNFIVAMYYRFYEGLKKEIRDPVQRKRHILENMLYMSELSLKNCFIVQQIFNISGDLKLNLNIGDSLKYSPDIKFDLVIGNPPYNEQLTQSGAKPLYNKFIEYYIPKCNMMSFVIPSRWFASGKGLDSFREMMLKRKDIVYMHHYDDACEVFGNFVEIKGGVNYFLIDSKYSGECNLGGTLVDFSKFDIIVDTKFYTLVNIFTNMPSITELYLGRCFGIESNDKRLSDTQKQGYIKCYVSQQKGFQKYIDPSGLPQANITTYKVCTARAAHEHKSGFGRIFICGPNEVHTGTYISFKTDSLHQANSLMSYLRTKFANLMLSLRKMSQDISENTCKWIPMVPLDREWNDSLVNQYFNLSEMDIHVIRSTKVTGYVEA